MDRLIWGEIDFNHKPLTKVQREAARKSRPKKNPRSATSYRTWRRNVRSHMNRCNPSIDEGYQGPIKLNRSKHWKPAADYYEARDLSQSNRDVV